jgi:hypothetical protein
MHHPVSILLADNNDRSEKVLWIMAKRASIPLFLFQSQIFCLARCRALVNLRLTKIVLLCLPGSAASYTERIAPVIREKVMSMGASAASHRMACRMPPFSP